jgi:hypothetical protein
MPIMTDAPATAVLPSAHPAPLRLFLLGRSAVVMVTSMTGTALFCLWVTLVAISPITVVAVLVLPATTLVRRYAELRRRGARRLLGPFPAHPYREAPRRGLIVRVWTIERDPASWRDAGWCLLHAIVSCVTATLSFALFASGVLALIYPFLFWVTPQRVFGRPFGGWVELHTVAQATAIMPLALVFFGLWYVLSVPLARAEVSLTRALLG